MRSIIEFLCYPNGNLERIDTGPNHNQLFQGGVGTALYILRMAVPNNENNWLPTDNVFIAFERPDGAKANPPMMYLDGAWRWQSNGWETDVNIVSNAVLKVNFIAKRESMTQVGATFMVQPSEQKEIIIQPTAGYVPGNISLSEAEEFQQQLSAFSDALQEVKDEIENIELKADGVVLTNGSSFMDKSPEVTDENMLKVATVESIVEGASRKSQVAFNVNDNGDLIAYYKDELPELPPYVDDSGDLIIPFDTEGDISVNVGHVGGTGSNGTIVKIDDMEQLEVNFTSDPQEQLNKKADLDEEGRILSSQLPSYVDDVLEFANKAAFPAVGESGKIYVDLSTNLTWRWSGSVYVEISPSLALGETSNTAFRGDLGKAAYDQSHTHSNKSTLDGITTTTTVTSGSSALVTSGGVHTAINNAIGSGGGGGDSDIDVIWQGSVPSESFTRIPFGESNIYDYAAFLVVTEHGTGFLSIDVGNYFGKYYYMDVNSSFFSIGQCNFWADDSQGFDFIEFYSTLEGTPTTIRQILGIKGGGGIF